MKQLLFIIPSILLLISCNTDKKKIDLPANSDIITDEVAKQESIPNNPLKEAYFGETHLHTAYSLDAYLGGTRLFPDDAYRFAKGEEVEVRRNVCQFNSWFTWL